MKRNCLILFAFIGLWGNIGSVMGGISAQTESRPITAENADEIIELSRLGFGYPNELDISPDDSMLAVASTTGVQVYDLNTFQFLFGNTDNWSNQVDWSPDGHSLVSVHYDGGLRLWDVKTGEVKHSWLAHEGQATSVAWSPDGAVIASRESGVEVKLWDVESSEIIFEHEAIYGYDMAWTLDSQKLILHSDLNPSPMILLGDEIEFYSGVTAKELAPYLGDDLFVNGSNTGGIVFIQNQNGHETISGDGSTRPYFRIENNAFLYLSVLGLKRAGVMKYSVKTNQTELLLDYDPLRFSYIMAWTSDLRIFVTGGIFGELELVDLPTGQTLGTLSGYHCCMGKLVWSPSQKQIAFSKNNQQQNLFIFDIEKNHISPGVSTYFDIILSSPNEDVVFKYIYPVGSMSWINENQLLISNSRGVGPSNGILVRDGLNGVTSLKLNQDNIGLKEFSDSLISPDGKYIAAIHSSGKRLFVYEISTKRLIHLRNLDSCRGYSVSWSFDSTKLIIGSCGEASGVEVWDLLNDESIRSWRIIERYDPSRRDVGPQVYFISHDENWLAGRNSYGDVWAIDARTGREKLFVFGDESYYPTVLAWSPVQPLLAIGMQNRLILWDATTQQEVATLSGFSGGLKDIVWSPDGRQIATIGEDDTIRIWGIP